MGDLTVKMPELKILNSREIKQILKLIEKQWGTKLKLDYGFLKSNRNEVSGELKNFAFLSNHKGRVFIVNKEISNIEFSKLRLNSVGMYFCEVHNGSIRLSIEGSQIIGPKATKNVAELDEDGTKKWLKGEDLEKECGNCKGFVILRHKNDFFGNGKYSKGRILNFVTKTRRINAI